MIVIVIVIVIVITLITLPILSCVVVIVFMRCLFFCFFPVKVLILLHVVCLGLSMMFLFFGFLLNGLVLVMMECVSLYCSILSVCFCFVVLCVSCCVILNGVDHLSVMDSNLFIVYLALSQLCMMSSVLSNDL